MQRKWLIIGAVVAGAIGLTGVAAAATTTTATSPFTVHNGTIRAAHGTPVPPSGTEASLWGDISYATIPLDGFGRVVVGAIGSDCGGWPTIRVLVDGAVLGEATITDAHNYGAYPVGGFVNPGHHNVEIHFIN